LDGGRALRLPGGGRDAVPAEGQPAQVRAGVGAGGARQGQGRPAAGVPVLGGAGPVARAAVPARQRPPGLPGIDPCREKVAVLFWSAVARHRFGSFGSFLDAAGRLSTIQTVKRSKVVSSHRTPKRPGNLVRLLEGNGS